MALNLLTAMAVAENVVRLVFDYPLSYTELGDPGDASNPACYTVTAISPARPVFTAGTYLNTVVDPSGMTIDITTDRSFSMDVSQYTIQVGYIVGTDGRVISDVNNTLNFFGVSREYTPPDPTTVFVSKDLANPQTMSALLDANGDTNPNELGTYVVDASGDYATDQGIDNLKKRVLRRLTTAKGAFLHAPGYGVGIPQRLKQLNIPHVREELVADATNQISQEPDVLKVLVTANISASDPMTCYFYVYIQTTLGFAVKYDVPFQITDPS